MTTEIQPVVRHKDTIYTTKLLNVVYLSLIIFVVLSDVKLYNPT